MEPEAQVSIKCHFPSGRKSFAHSSPLDISSWSTGCQQDKVSALMKLVYPPMTSILYWDVLTLDRLKFAWLSHPLYSAQLLTDDQKDGWPRRMSNWVISPSLKTVTDTDGRKIEIVHVLHSYVQIILPHTHTHTQRIWGWKALHFPFLGGWYVSQPVLRLQTSLWNVSWNLFAGVGVSFIVFIRFVMLPQVRLTPWCLGVGGF